ncbi:hypothetical protein CTI12_AA437950 [Artemisia annua]|uniref:Avr9/Cf-9 rapidly elicited protein 146 n=1 Tax=Artemisia annua TaxID=35608 RepID=A0A2U1LZ04_ARTAN|nr:hypothetical protein CTI12_AA437950 [Artemisia annua]
MEQNLPLAAKKVWSLVRVMLFMLRKNISKRKLLLDINMLMKRGKLAGKALQNLMFHHHHNWSSSSSKSRSHVSSNFTFPPPRTEDYEFSCSNTPVYPLSLFSSHKKHNYKKNSQKKSAIKEDHDEIYVDAVIIKALEMLTSATASPALPGFGKSPMVRQLRITDSPFPLSNGDEDSYVDEAAEKFIMKFYKELRRES